MTASALAQSPLLTQRERLWPLACLSLCLHAAAIASALLLHKPSAQVDLEQKPIVAKLVRLGQKRPQQLLPRKEEAPPPPAAAEKVSIPAEKPQPPAPPAPPAAPVAKAKPAPPAPRAPPSKAAGKGDVLASVLSKVKRDKALSEPIYGDPEGDPLGDASEASAGDQYLALVERALRESYVLPATISERDRLHLKATVVLHIDADGQVLRYTFESKSGNGAFDAALERAIRAARVPPPPTELRKKYRDEGLGVVYRP